MDKDEKIKELEEKNANLESELQTLCGGNQFES